MWAPGCWFEAAVLSAGLCAGAAPRLGADAGSRRQNCRPWLGAGLWEQGVPTSGAGTLARGTEQLAVGPGMRGLTAVWVLVRSGVRGDAWADDEGV